MTLNADMMVERRRLRRQLTFWRIGAFAALIAGLVAVGWLLVRGQNAPGAAHVARVQIEGLITGKQETFDLLKDIENPPAAKALVLRISSGGGTTSGSEALYLAVKRLAEKKPVIAVIDGVGASGAYMTALGAERIVANGSAIVGSIGVIAQVPNVSKLLETLGVKVESVRSTPLKAMPSGVEPTSPEARAALELTVRDSYQWFRNLVGERRQLSGDALQSVADGRVFTGRQSLELKLIDEVGGEREALAWLSTAKGLASDIPVRDYRPKTQRNRLPAIVALHEAARVLGLPVPEAVDQFGERLLGSQALEGLVSVWHPASP
jgi:protease-4